MVTVPSQSVMSTEMGGLLVLMLGVYLTVTSIAVRDGGRYSTLIKLYDMSVQAQ